MNKKLFSKLTLALFAAAVIIPIAVWSLPSFSIKDQYKKSHSQSIMSGAKVVVIASHDRKSGDLVSAWAKALVKSVKGAKIIGFCNLKGYPFFLPNSLVTNALKKKVPRKVKVLVDWKGKTYKKMFPKGKIMIVIYKNGKKVTTIKGAYSKARLATVMKALK